MQRVGPAPDTGHHSIQVVAVRPEGVRRGWTRSAGRELRDLAAVPMAVVGVFAVLAAVCIVGDRSNHVVAISSARRVVAHLISKQAAGSTLSAIATGLVTVTSITCSVLLVAVQQSASNLAPVVFDQFLRRRSNQAFLSFFVGLASFSYIVMAAVGSTPPVLGAAAATVLTVVALGILLTLIYTTIDQMRPTNVLATLRDRSLKARRHESELLRRTRRARTSRHEAVAVCVSHVTGYVTGIDIEQLARLLHDPEDGEITLHVTLGSAVAYGDLIATVRGGDEHGVEELAQALGDAVQLSRQRNVGNDPTTGIDQIGNIAWTSGSTAKHNPEIADEALHMLRDLAARWLEPADDGADEERLPVVYHDAALERSLDWIYSLAVATQESHQHMVAADVLDAYTALVRLDGHCVARQRLSRDFQRLQPLLDQLPPSPQLDQARRRLAQQLADASDGGRHAS